MPVETTAARAAVLEIERFEWAAPNRIEIVGHWTGLHGRRFMRPTLVLKGEGDPKRLLALLEHKPWAASDGEGGAQAVGGKRRRGVDRGLRLGRPGRQVRGRRAERRLGDRPGPAVTADA